MLCGGHQVTACSNSWTMKDLEQHRLADGIDVDDVVTSLAKQNKIMRWKMSLRM